MYCLFHYLWFDMPAPLVDLMHNSFNLGFIQALTHVISYKTGKLFGVNHRDTVFGSSCNKPAGQGNHRSYRHKLTRGR